MIKARKGTPVYGTKYDNLLRGVFMNTKKNVNLGIIGSNNRARGLLTTLTTIPEAHISAVCDLIEERAQKGADIIKEKSGYMPDVCTDYHEILAKPDIDAVIIATSWNEHVGIAIDAMKAGKYTGFEVGGTSSIEQLSLIHISTFFLAQ